MKKYFLFIIFFLLVNCSGDKSVYWCGDHPCINKKEKESYFKKTMIVEKKPINKNSYKDKSELDKLLEQAKLDEKDRKIKDKDLKKQTKLEKKRRVKEKKLLKKQAKLEEKRRLKEEKALKKQIKKEEKSLKKVTKTKKKTKKKILKKENIEISKDFNQLVEKIIKKNSFRPYPDINDIPN